MAAEPNVSGQRVIAGLKPLVLLVGVAAAVAAGVGVMLWSVGPTYSLLYANMSGEDAAQVTQALDSARIPYKLEDAGGSISVPAEQLAAARLKLAAQGLPEGGGGVSAMTKDPGFGVSGVDNGFAKLLKQGLDSVNATQSKATDLATKFERGVPGVELPQVMLEMQKANVSFRALTEVRNKFIDAYREIMNMPL